MKEMDNNVASRQVHCGMNAGRRRLSIYLSFFYPVNFRSKGWPARKHHMKDTI
jgi:hypothetical protein